MGSGTFPLSPRPWRKRTAEVAVGDPIAGQACGGAGPQLRMLSCARMEAMVARGWGRTSPNRICVRSSSRPLACLFSFFLSFRVEGALGSLTPRLLNTQARSSLGSSKPDSDARTTTSRRTWRARQTYGNRVQCSCCSPCVAVPRRALGRAPTAPTQTPCPARPENRKKPVAPAPRARRNIAARSRRRPR